MRIKLISRKESFDFDIDPSLTISDLKNLIISQFGFPKEALSSLKIIIMQVIQRDGTKTLAELNVTEGSSINFHLPNSFKPSKIPSLPSNEVPHQSCEAKSMLESQNSNKASTNSLPEIPNPQAQNKPEKEPFFQSQNIQQTQPINPQYPPPTNNPEEHHFFSSPEYSSSYQNDTFQNPFVNSSMNQNSILGFSFFPDPDPIKLKQLLEMGYDEHRAKVFLRRSNNNIESCIEEISSPFYQNEVNFNRLERFLDGTINQQELVEFLKDYNKEFKQKNAQNTKNALTQFFKNLAESYQARAQNTNTSNLYNTPLYQATQPNTNGSNIFNSPLYQAIQPNTNGSNIFNSPLYQNQMTNQEQAVLQLQNMLQQYQQQRLQQQPQQSALMQKDIVQFQYLAQMIYKMIEIKKQRPDEFVNPFIEIYQNLVGLNMADDEFGKAVGKATTFNRDQVLFILEWAKCRDFNYIVSVLDATNGNIDEARAILYSQ